MTPLPHVTVTLSEDQWHTILSWYGPVEGEGYDDAEDHAARLALAVALKREGATLPEWWGDWPPVEV